MSRELWTSVDDYVTELFVPPDKALASALKASRAAGLPGIQVTPSEGKLLFMLAKMNHARNILEIGTLGGYSAIWLGRALPKGGKLITLEFDAKHADVARKNIERAGLSKVVEIRLGKAMDTLPRLAKEKAGPFDLFFIDADKPNNTNYFNWALKLSRPGSLIIVDNVVRSGAVIDPKSKDESVQGVRKFNKAMAAEPRVMAVEIQTVGSKGYDGMAFALVTS